MGGIDLVRRGAGGVQIGGDLGGTNTAPTVVGVSHMAGTLPGTVVVPATLVAGSFSNAPSSGSPSIAIGTGTFGGGATPDFQGTALLGVNAPSGYVNTLADFQIAGASKASIDQNGTFRTLGGAGVFGGGAGVQATKYTGTTGLTTLLVGVSTGKSTQVSSFDASTVASVIRGVTSQTADLTQWQDIAANILARIDAYGNLSLPAVTPPGALTATLSATAGVVDAGNHTYAVTFVTANGETSSGTTTLLTTADGAHRVDLSAIPIGPNGVTSRKIYRSKAGTTTPLFALTTLADNTTTTYADATADASLPVTQIPTFNMATPWLNVGAWSLRPCTNGSGGLQSSGTFTASTYYSIGGSFSILSDSAGATIPAFRAGGGMGAFLGSASGTTFGASSSQGWTGNFLDFQSNGASRLSVDYQGNLTLSALPLPTAPTVALAGSGAGNVTNGTHVVAITFVNANGETMVGASSASVNVVSNATNGQISVTSIPTGSSGVTSRKVYMSKAGTTTPLYLVATIADNVTTTTTINTADASLVTASPGGNSTAGALVMGARKISLDVNGNFTVGGASFVCGQLYPSQINMQTGSIAFDTVTGGKIGSTAANKIGFYGATPVIQQTGGAATAAATYGTNEQTMLQTLYNALRAYGLLS